VKTDELASEDCQ